ncbi:MAG: hypothetical protein QW318_07695 [Candidatus Caldarchaeum sp.]
MTYEEWLKKMATAFVENGYTDSALFLNNEIKYTPAGREYMKYNRLYLKRFCEEGYGFIEEGDEWYDRVVHIDFTDKFKALMELVK